MILRLAISLPVLVMASVALAQPATSQPADPSSDSKTLEQRVIDAYRSVKTFSATKTIAFTSPHDEDNHTEEMAFRIVFDRAASGLRFEDDAMSVVIHKGVLIFQTDEVKSHYVKTDAPDPLSYEKLLASVPLSDWILSPEIPLLLEQRPSALLPMSSLAESDERGETHTLAYDTAVGRISFEFDPKTHYVTRSTLAPRQPQGLVIECTYEDAAYDKRLDKNAFAYDAGARKPVDSISELTAMLRPKHRLVGKAAPPVILRDIDGNTVDLSKSEAKVIVLDFWATWCGPCRMWMPMLAKVEHWAKQNKKPVEFYAINQRDTIAEARHFMQASQLDTHVLMDDRGEISFAYEANALPSTVIISDGKIAHYVQGAAPGLEKLIQKYIKTALTKDEAE